MNITVTWGELIEDLSWGCAVAVRFTFTHLFILNRGGADLSDSHLPINPFGGI